MKNWPWSTPAERSGARPGFNRDADTARSIRPVRWSSVDDRQETVLIVASGPSLKGFDFDALHNKGYVIAVNGAGRFMPWADLWLTVDTLQLQSRVPRPFAGKLVAAVPADFGTATARCPCDRIVPNAPLHYLKRVNAPGLSEYSCQIRGLNSAYGALNYAYHLRAKRVVLFGVDGNDPGSYFYGMRRAWAKQNATLMHLPQLFESALPQLRARKIEVLNASSKSAVDCFDRVAPQEALRHL